MFANRKNLIIIKRGKTYVFFIKRKINCMPEVLWNGFVEFITSFVNLLIAIWMIPVMVAWQLLTNNFVYWEFLWFDKTLWHMWNISKVFANYTIWFIFIFSIFKYFFATKEWDFNIIKSTLPKIVVASLVVNMSWFILWFLLDLSTLMIAALWNLPTAFIDENPKIHKEITLPKSIKITLWDNKKKVVEKSWSQKVNTDDLLAWENSATWPLFYLWNSILEINDLAIQDSAGEKKIENISPIFIIKIVVVLAFMIPIIILIIINLIRIFRIWLYIAFAPLIALDIVFGSKIANEHNKAFIVGNLLWMIFQPVLVVGSLSLAVIMIAGIENAFTNPNDPELEGVLKELNAGKVGPKSWTITNPYTLDTMVMIGWSDSLKKSWWPIWWFLLTFLSVFLMWALVKASFKFSNVASKIGGRIMEFGEDAAKTIPIFGWKHSIWSITYAGKQVKAFPESFLRPQNERLHKKIDEWFGMDSIRDIDDYKYKNFSHEMEINSHGGIDDDYKNFRKILDKQKITNSKDLEFTPNVAKLYKQLLKKMIHLWEERRIFGKYNKFNSWRLTKLSELDDGDFIKNLEVHELLDIIIKQK